MSKTELSRQLKEKNPSISLSEAALIIDIFVKKIKKELKSNRTIELRGFGSFYIKRIKEKFSARNPKTGELIYIPEKKKVRFRPSKNLKKEIND